MIASTLSLFNTAAAVSMSSFSPPEENEISPGHSALGFCPTMCNVLLPLVFHDMIDRNNAHRPYRSVVAT
jgi:hypothetical protein